MDPNTFPTKGNLILAKNTLRLSNQGYELMDKKRNVLIREILDLNEKAIELQTNIERIFKEAYAALQHANIEMGITNVERISYGVPIEETIKIRTRSIMGVDIPIVTYDNSTSSDPCFGFGNTSTALDTAMQKFNDVKDLIIQLAMIENAAYRLAVNIRKTQKRANALKNVTIPKYEELTKQIQQTLEERERDEFTRLKVIKKKT
jgi:V/A-type H+-transporting ATPase subunit D